MTDYYCKVCYRTLDRDREICFHCERQPSGIAVRVSNVLLVIAVPTVIAGMLGLDMRLCAAGAVVAVIGLIARFLG